MMKTNVVKKTKAGDEMRFKLENNNLMVCYKPINDEYVLVIELVEKNILTNHEIEILTEGSEEFGLRLVFKPNLI